MKRIVSTVLRLIILVVFVFSVGHAFAQQGTQEKQQTEKRKVPVRSIPRPLPDMTRMLQEANKAFRSAVATEMQAAARQAGVKIRTDNFVAIPFDDSGTVFVNAMIEGADRLRIEELAKGADVLFVYSGAKLGSADRRGGLSSTSVANRFYVVRVLQNPASGQWIAQFKNLQGQVVLETDATVDKPDSNGAKMQPICTLGPKGELILFDEHDPFKNVTIELDYEACTSCEGLRFVSESRKLREVSWQFVQARVKNPKGQVLAISLGEISIDEYVTQYKVIKICGKEPCMCSLVDSGPHHQNWSCTLKNGDHYNLFINM